MYSVFLLSYRNTSESLGELEKLWKHSPVHFSFSQTSTCGSKLDRNTVHFFYFFNTAPV